MVRKEQETLLGTKDLYNIVGLYLTFKSSLVLGALFGFVFISVLEHIFWKSVWLKVFVTCFLKIL